MAKTKKQQVADTLLSMTYEEFMELCDELVRMQISLKEDSNGADEWKPNDLYGDTGLMSMLYSWAESTADG